MILILMGVLVGAVLGLRFKVFGLVPVLFGGLAIVVVDGIASGDGVLQLALAIAMTAVALQMGYVLGIVMAAARAPGRVSTPTSAEISGSV
jgi:hypothetical protein